MLQSLRLLIHPRALSLGVFILGAALFWRLPQAPAAEAKPLIDLAAGWEKRILPSDAAQVSIAGTPEGVVVTCRPGQGGYPGVSVKPDGAVWDLSAFGRVEARITNTGTEGVTVCLRVDDDGDWQTNPWNAENLYLPPGKTGTALVRFGYSWGKPGHALKSGKVVQLLLFTEKPKTDRPFRIESIVAAGAPGEKPPVRPEDVRTKPAGGILLGKGSKLDAATQLEARGAQAELAAAGGAQTLRVTVPAGAKPDASARLKPAEGRWDLRDSLQVTVRARNVGKAPATLKARLECGHACEWVSAPAPMAPGAVQELTLPFAGGVMMLQAKGQPKGGSQFESDRASGISIGAEGEGERALVIEQIRAEVPPAPKLPAWLGKQPPVPGEWRQTMAEEFDGRTLNEKIWTIYHPNYWDKRSHFSKDNVILGGGLLRLRFEKKRGHHCDDPKQPETDWQTGFITSTHKWTQRYGYFECRMKLPTAPGMWPAFWMMPDRGDAAGISRESTSNGGMEFDILEYLARYGPYRYNIAAHWDDYGPNHKSTGTERLYVQPDKEGFLTAGLLWEPGKATWYCQGIPIVVWEDERVASVPEYILFTAVSGGWGGNELTGEGLPSDFVLDYVRVWQRKDWAGMKP